MYAYFYGEDSLFVSFRFVRPAVKITENQRTKKLIYTLAYIHTYIDHSKFYKCGSLCAFRAKLCEMVPEKLWPGLRLKGGKRQRIPCKCWQNRFLTTYFFWPLLSRRISWPAGWQSDSLARIVSPLPNWLPASLCRFQQAKHVPASNLSFVFSFRLLFSSEQVDDGLVSTGREQPLFFCWLEPTTWSGHIFIICIIICVIYGFKTEYLMRLVPWVSRLTSSPLFDWLVRRILEVRLVGLIGWI